ncbi:hypothetical protein [Trinickia mobilis]|nr:hypothetical protein [Trinickia mobilis]
MPKEVKVKLGGHHGLERKWLVKKVLGFITRAGAADNPQTQKMRDFRIA